MKKHIEIYNETGMVIKADGANITDRKLIENYIYHVSFFIDEFYRTFSCIYNQKYYQADLYGGDEKVLLIQYYRHHSWNLLNYLGMIKDGVDKINGLKVCKDILKFKFDKSTRNFIAHIYEKMNKINETTGLLHGFNVIFDIEDEYLREIKEPVFNLDLISKEITMIVIDRGTPSCIQNDYKINLEQMRCKIDDLNSQVLIMKQYTKAAWYLN